MFHPCLPGAGLGCCSVYPTATRLGVGLEAAESLAISLERTLQEGRLDVCCTGPAFESVHIGARSCLEASKSARRKIGQQKDLSRSGRI